MAADAPLGLATLKFLRETRDQINALLDTPRVLRLGPLSGSLKCRGEELNKLRAKIAHRTFSAADRCRVYDIHADVCAWGEHIMSQVK